MTLLIKDFVKKLFIFNISFFKKCYVHDIFTINFHNIVNLSYSNIFIILIYIYWHAPTPNQTNPFPFSFSFSFFSFHFTSATRANPSPFVFFLFLFLYFPPHVQPHSPHPRTSSPWSLQVISLNFTKNLQYLFLFITPKPNGNWS